MYPTKTTTLLTAIYLCASVASGFNIMVSKSLTTMGPVNKPISQRCTGERLNTWTTGPSGDCHIIENYGCMQISSTGPVDDGYMVVWFDDLNCDPEKMVGSGDEGDVEGGKAHKVSNAKAFQVWDMMALEGKLGP